MEMCSVKDSWNGERHDLLITCAISDASEMQKSLIEKNWINSFTCGFASRSVSLDSLADPDWNLAMILEKNLEIACISTLTTGVSSLSSFWLYDTHGQEILELRSSQVIPRK